jgi:chromosome partitioning protein
VLEPPIAKSVRFAEAPAAGRSVLCTAGAIPGAQAYRAHAQAFLSAGGAGDRVVSLPRERGSDRPAGRAVNA